MARKQKETLLDSIIKEYNSTSVKELMIEDFKQSLLKPEKLNFIDNNPMEGEYRCFVSPDEDGIMYCDFRVWKQKSFPYEEPMYTFATVKAIPQLIYTGTNMKAGIIHCANICDVPYVIIYSVYEG